MVIYKIWLNQKSTWGVKMEETKISNQLYIDKYFVAPVVFPA